VRLGLGAAQFGLDYGVTNLAGRPGNDEVAAIIDEARREGVTLIDTAAGYGDSERTLGSLIQDEDQFGIVTKIPDWKGTPPSAAGEAINDAFERSLAHLHRRNVDALLVHNADDLLSECGEEIWSTMVRLRDSGRARRIGVSVYTSEQIDQVLAEMRPDVVQLPLSVLDQRLDRSGHLHKLRAAGTEVHARSVFLQGVLLAPAQTLPERLSRLRGAVARFQEAARKADATPVEAALAYIQSTAIDVAIVGVTSVAEFSAVNAAMKACVATELNWRAFAAEDAASLDPRNWPAGVTTASTSDTAH
tara:strand:+ start:40340 stop:41251 length:912 start_codon:yes stop_codon:yes gene_type:complete